MREKWNFTRSPGCSIPNIASWEVSNEKKQAFLIQISWPLDWESAEIATSANTLYLVDGNAIFLSATDVVRRRRDRNPHGPGTIVVGIGYPLTHSVFSARRAFDLTPPCEKYEPPAGPDGHPLSPPYGGADQLLAFMTDIVKPFLASSVFPNISLNRSALFGHSYGGLFVLHALFTQLSLFNAYLAASPSIWWNDRFILSEESGFYRGPPPSPLPAVRLSYGSREQFPVCERGESAGHFAQRRHGASLRRMTDNCCEMYARLTRSGRVGMIEKWEYMDEDHGSVIAAALSGGILYFLDMEL